ncbi:carbohydrate binding domain-containing protein [Coprobacter secundus]|uniref:CBM-cenC domain-containing protein n=2 Tax=Coprobacter secundus TaxID=1501392 RepID=A0A7G1HTS0_9BACT|nr:carbohydrate binding domain-containing protein [Coprobacter secundus]BCI63036.1 hypothetical protein Cop2CBH44_13890 [Coprobacter secundus subsp. similis]
MRKFLRYLAVAGLFFMGIEYSLSAEMRITRPDYLSDGRMYYDLLTANYSEAKIQSMIANKSVRWICNYMAAEGIMYKATLDQKYLDRCLYVFTETMTQWRSNKTLMSGTDDFFATKHIAYTYRLLQELGKVEKGAYDDVVLGYANSHFQPTFIVDHNQAQERALGFVLMQKVLPNAPDVDKWKTYTDAVWDFWYNNLDVDEDATNYSAIHLNDIMMIAEETGKTDLLRRDEVKKWFTRYRDQQAPSGFMPEYGDDYFFAYFNWVICFERMARIFNDPSFLNAAWKLYRAGFYNLAASYKNANFDMKLASEWSVLGEISLLPSMEAEPLQTDVGALVTNRTNKYGVQDIPDQLLLASARTPGVPFVMSDLYSRGSHSHPHLRGTINYYETDNYPLFHGVQRHATDARCGNTVVLVKQEDEGFPFASGGSRRQTDKWFTDCVDFSSSTEISSTDATMRGFAYLTFRLVGQVGEEIYIDNVRLIGKKGELLLHDCNSLTNWSTSYTSLSSDAVSGNSVKITLANTNTNFITLKVSKSFSLNDYQYVAFDWKHKSPVGAATTDLNFIFRVQNSLVLPGDEYVDATVGTLFNYNVLTDAYTEMQGNDCYGVIELDNHFLPGTQLKRRILLTEEGVLILQDYLLPGDGAEGYTAGSLWQMYNLKSRGENWFNAGEERSWVDWTGKEMKKELLVYFEKNSVRTYGSQLEEYSVAPTVVYAKQAISSSQPLTFTTILVPHEVGTNPEFYANSISSTTVGRQSNISLNTGGKILTIALNEDGSWNVAREIAAVDPDEKSIITNGHIDYVTGNLPNDWVVAGDNAKGCVYDTEVGYINAGSLRLTGNGSDWNGWMHTDNIIVEEGETYKFGVYVKTENVSSTSDVYVSFGIKRETGRIIVSETSTETASVLSDNLKGTHDWKLIEGTYTIPSTGYRVFSFTPRLSSTSVDEKVWFDDFYITKVEPTALPDEWIDVEGINIYPNPVSSGEILGLSFSTCPGKNIVTLYDMVGGKKMDLYNCICGNTERKNLTIRFPEYDSGIYLVHFQNAGINKTFKLLVK